MSQYVRSGNSHGHNREVAGPVDRYERIRKYVGAINHGLLLAQRETGRLYGMLSVHEASVVEMTIDELGELLAEIGEAEEDRRRPATGIYSRRKQTRENP